MASSYTRTRESASGILISSAQFDDHGGCVYGLAMNIIQAEKNQQWLRSKLEEKETALYYAIRQTLKENDVEY